MKTAHRSYRTAQANYGKALAAYKSATDATYLSSMRQLNRANKSLRLAEAAYNKACKA